jgi:hypothetical protein
MIVPTLNPYAISLIVANNAAAVAATPPAQAATQRPTPPPGKSEMPRSRDRRSQDQSEKTGAKGERGQSTDLTV